MSTFNERMARAFQSLGYKVDIITFALQYPGFLFPGKSQYSEEPKPEDLHIEVMINSVNPLNWISTGNKLRNRNYDLVLVRYWLPFMGPSLGTILRRIKTNGHSKIICIADNVIPHEKRPGDKTFTSYFIKAVDGFITMSKKVKEDLQIFNKTKPAELVNHPLYDNFGTALEQDVAKEKLGLSDTKFVILFFGFIRKYKGLNLLIEAMKKVAAEIKDAKLVVAGEFYEDKEKYLEQVETLGLQDVIRFEEGFISDAEVRNYFCAADLVVQPYLSATQSGVTPLAYHFELPMIVTNVGGLPDMVDHESSGLVTEPDAARIAESIIEYHKKGKRHFIPALRENKKNYSWERFTDTILNLYSKL